MAFKFAPSARAVVNGLLTLTSFGFVATCAQAQTIANEVADEMRYQQFLAVQNIVAHQKRLSSIGYKILRAGVPECKEHIKPDLGFMALAKQRLPADGRELLAQALGVGNEFKVVAVYKGGPAEKAGLQEGDIFVDSQSPAIPRLGEADDQTRLRLAQAITVEILRQEAIIKLKLEPELICSDLLRIDPSNDVNAFAQGRLVIVTRGMMRFASRDRDLALVIAHEIAHNALGHTGHEVPRIGIDKVLGTMFSDKGASSIDRDAPDYYKTLELQADTLGLYLLARAGYDLYDVPGFWRSMAIEYPSYIRSTHSSRHPSTPERFLNMDKMTNRILEKIKSNLPLKPDFVN